MIRNTDLTGHKYHKLTVVGFNGKDNRHQSYWNCVCDCGGLLVVRGGNLVSGHTKSCGCWKMRSDGDAKKLKLYGVWNTMKSRCNRPTSAAYKRYGGRGISICNEWKESYQAFKRWALMAGYREGLSIDRINNNGSYCPENCRWITMSKQSENKRSNIWLTHNGQTHIISQWAKILSVPSGRLFHRYHRGFSVDIILSEKKLVNAREWSNSK